MKISIMCGDFFIGQEDLPNKEPLRSVMIDIIGADASCCGNKKAYLSLLKYTAKKIIKDLTSK